MTTMKAVVFKGKDRIAVEEVPKPVPRAGEAVIRITTTTICGTDVHIVRGEYPVKPGFILGHEPVGVIERARAWARRALHGRPARHRRRDYAVRAVLLLPERQPFAVRRRHRRMAVRQHHQRRLGGVPARAGRARQPCADPGRPDRRRRRAVSGHLLDRSVGSGKREHPGRRRGRGVRAGTDRPVRHAGAKLKGASLIIGIDSNNARLDVARRLGANVTINTADGDPIAAIKRLTDGRGVDVAIEALGTPGNVRERAARDPAGRDAVQSRRLFRQARRALRGVLRRPWRSEDRHHALPGWQRAHAAADVDGRTPARRSRHRS